MFFFAASLPAPLIYRPGQGWEAEGEDAIEETSNSQLEKGMRYDKEGRLEQAANAYRTLVKTWPLSPNAPEAQFRLAATYFKLYDFQRSFKEFQKCVEKYPDSEHFEETLKFQNDIASLFLAGEKQKIWIIPTLPSMDKAVEMFEQIIKNAPYSKVAPETQLKIGFAREKQHLWTDAVKAFQELIRRYPKSDLADDAQFQIGYAYMKAAQDPDHDQTATNHAITGFEDYLTKYPGSEKAQQARENIDRMKHGQAEGVMAIAGFYEHDRNYDAAIVYYNRLIQQFPHSELAKRASERVEELKRRHPGKTSEQPRPPPPAPESAPAESPAPETTPVESSNSP